MRWMLMGCLLGAIGAALGRVQSPMTFWVNIIGLIVFVVGIFDLLRLSGFGNRNSGSGDSGLDFDSNTSCDSSGDCGGGDGGD